MKSKLWLTVVFNALLGLAAWAQNPPPNANDASAQRYFAEAQKLARDGKYDDAQAAFAKGLELQPGNEAAVMRQAGVFMELNRSDDALKIWDKWIALKPDDVQRWDYKAIAAGESGRTEEALKAVDKMTELQPNNPDGWRGKAQCLGGLGRNEEALKAIDRAIELDPMSDDSWRIRLAIEPNLKEYAGSIKFCSKLFAQNPKCIGAIYDRAGLYAMAGDKTRALADLKTALTIRSDNDTKAFVRQDDRLKDLRDDPGFQQLIASDWHRSAPNITLKVVSADSQETAGEDGKAANAVDGKPDTFWHTQWQGSAPRHPHEVVIELIPPSLIKGFIYLPRQDSQDNGTIRDYAFFVSNDGKNFGAPVVKGTFPRDKQMKTVTFDAKSCRFIKLKALSEINEQPWTSAAEIDVIAQ